MGVKWKPDIIDIKRRKDYNGMAMSKGCQRRDEKEDVLEKHGWKEYKQP
jgi:hypothetical protein